MAPARFAFRPALALNLSERRMHVPNFKHILVMAIVALVAVAIASRVGFLKGLVFA